MPAFLAHDDVAFERGFAALLAQKREADADVAADVAEIIDAVRADGAKAVATLTARFDRWDAAAETLAIPAAEIDAAIARVPAEQAEALELASARIRAYHDRQRPENQSWEDATGAELGWRWTPVDAAGLYVPGGLAAYPSSVLMNAIPAKVAGVGRLAMAVPTPDALLNPLVLLAARLCGIDEIWRIGGAQAVAALAFGAGPIRPVDVITGPGNAWVAEAKRQVFGRVGIDMIAGPSEVLILADAANDPDWVAIDLLAQAEHDSAAQALLITDDAAFGAEVARAVERRLQSLARGEIAAASWAQHGAVIVVRDWNQAAALTNRIAPEHLEIAVADPEPLLAQIRHAGAIFLGAMTPEAIGDYVGGPNHVLPTARSARFSSGLSVLDFMKRTTIARMTAESLAAIGPAAEALARAEGLEAHGLSVRARLDALPAKKAAG
ncbi:MAG: histidinol dehydrogenase [Pseudomonadota bacterium]